MFAWIKASEIIIPTIIKPVEIKKIEVIVKNPQIKVNAKVDSEGFFWINTIVNKLKF